jgi:hypothetical protein
VEGRLGLIEMLLFFGLVFGFAFHQWWQWRRWKRQQQQKKDEP